MFHPSRAAGLAALDRFAPHAGRAYSNERNHDLAPDGSGAVSQLSPYIRHRLITEKEVVQCVLTHHSQADASKFLQEVFWRGYWKGWLQMRPSVWTGYKAALQASINRLQTESGLRSEFEAACLGQTEIDCFNYWSQQLINEGYIHNHARMWFASIWIFTLRLPWALGADFFMRHLLDGDPASNTLSWRWVAGLQTKGKTYLATAENIEKFTHGRFRPDPASLASVAVPLEGAEHPDRLDIPALSPARPDLKTGLLIHEDDMLADHVADLGEVVCFVSGVESRSPLAISSQVQDFVSNALTARAAGSGGKVFSTPNAVIKWAEDNQLEQVVTPFAPVGSVADILDQLERHLREKSVPLVRVMRPYDRMCWPKATHGFFRFKEHIPDFIANI